MTNEDMSIDVDDFVDSGIEEAGEKLQDQLEEEGSILNPEDNPPEKETEQTQEQETETPAETKKAEVNTEAEETNETSAQADSTISQLIQNTTEQRVPVEDHIKLRQRAQKAEQERDELRQRLTQQNTQPSGGNDEEVDPLAELDEEDLVRVGPIREYVGKAVNNAVDKVQQALGLKEAAIQAKATADRAVNSEKEFVKTTPDYNTVTKASLKLGLLTAEEKANIANAENPAQEFYKVSKAKLKDIQTTLGITPASTDIQQQQKNETVVDPDDDIPSDDEVLEVFG